MNDASPGTDGAGTRKGKRGDPGLDEQRTEGDYGSRNVFSQPRHAGARKLAPVESQRPACGVLEQLQHRVSVLSAHLRVFFLKKLVSLFLLAMAHLRWQLVYKTAVPLCSGALLLFMTQQLMYIKIRSPSSRFL